MFIRVLALDVHAKIYCPYLPCFLHLSFGVIKTCPEPQHVVNGLDCSMGETRTWFAIRTAPCLQARKERREKREVQFRSRITGPQGRGGPQARRARQLIIQHPTCTCASIFHLFLCEDGALRLWLVFVYKTACGQNLVHEKNRGHWQRPQLYY